MSEKQIDPPIWDLLVKAIHKGECVPFLGAAANVGGAGFEIPTGVKLAKDLVCYMTGLKGKNPEDLVKLEPPLDGHKEMLRSGVTDLARVSLHLMDKVGPKDFLDQIRSRLINAKSRPSPLLRTLADLPFELIVTTNYDNMMEVALRERGRPFYPVVQPMRGFEEKEGLRINTELQNYDGVRLYKIHGELPPEADGRGVGEEAAAAAASGETSPIIITEEDYIQFLTVLREPTRGVPRWIVSKITSGRVLFLGYGLEDWDFRTLYESLIAPIPRYLKPGSYAIQWQPPAFWVKYWESRGVKIYDMDIKEFAAQLREKYEEEYGKLPAPEGGGDVV